MDLLDGVGYWWSGKGLLNDPVLPLYVCVRTVLTLGIGGRLTSCFSPTLNTCFRSSNVVFPLNVAFPSITACSVGYCRSTSIGLPLTSHCTKLPLPAIPTISIDSSNKHLISTHTSIRKPHLKALRRIPRHLRLRIWHDIVLIVAPSGQRRLRNRIRLARSGARITKDTANVRGVGIRSITAAAGANAQPVITERGIRGDDDVVALAWCLGECKVAR
jgi:hypothetical protein